MKLNFDTQVCIVELLFFAIMIIIAYSCKIYKFFKNIFSFENSKNKKIEMLNNENKNLIQQINILQDIVQKEMNIN